MDNHRHKLCASFVGAIAALALLPASAGPKRKPRAFFGGFLQQHVAAERKLEDKFETIPDPARIEVDLRHLTAEPHLAGTEASRRVAEWLRDQYRSYGFDTQIVTYTPWLPLPREIKVEMVAPMRKQLGTPEQPYDGDKDTSDSHILPAFNSYSPSGDVTAPLVYANYGTAEDYRALESLGVDVAGKIVLVRYGKNYRGIKADLAEEHEAAGLLIYSDPEDDGYVVGDPYPRGPWRPLSGIQRGSILYTQIYPGDPLTPGVPASPDTKRIVPANASNLPRIPTVPLSADDASAILTNLGGKNVPRGWQGGLPLTYHTGPGDEQIHLQIAMDYQQRPIYDVIAKLHGADDNSWVILGNHHDAWVFGAADPGSGTTAMLETARSLGELAHSGWKPRRTIVICEWDAEEPGLIGSTEWVEGNLAELQKKAVAYINTDVGVTGQDFSAAATPSLNDLVRNVAREVKDPSSGKTLYDVWQARYSESKFGQTPPRGRDQRPALPVTPGPPGEVPIGALGAGSDFCPFFDHAGIPSIDVSFTGPYGVYHSMYDDFYWMKQFGDPTFQYEAALARVLGVLALRLGEADILPFNYQEYASEITQATDELSARASFGRKGAAPENQDAALKALSDASAQLAQAAALATQALQKIRSQSPTPEAESAINAALDTIDQALLAPEGLAGRSWYKHTIFAPGRYAGYDAEILPAVDESFGRDPAVFAREAESLTAALLRATARLNDVARIAGGTN
ncbi:MAG TPA: M28 family metallopeptidase [Candidatus Acidoferrales bacterium]|nr:M28 family metallopeptidase [Candidatus Acidoferrales bacterium]